MCLCFTASDDSVYCTKTQRKKRRQKENPAPQLHSNSATDITDRLASFADCRVDKQILSSYAAAGFSYHFDSGYIYCDLCGLALAGLIDSSTHNDPLSLHLVHRPDCGFLLSNNGYHTTAEQNEGDGKIADHPAFCFLCRPTNVLPHAKYNYMYIYSDSIPFGISHNPFRPRSDPSQYKRVIKTIALDP